MHRQGAAGGWAVQPLPSFFYTPARAPYCVGPAPGMHGRCAAGVCAALLLLFLLFTRSSFLFALVLPGAHSQGAAGTRQHPDSFLLFPSSRLCCPPSTLLLVCTAKVLQVGGTRPDSFLFLPPFSFLPSCLPAFIWLPPLLLCVPAQLMRLPTKEMHISPFLMTHPYLSPPPPLLSLPSHCCYRCYRCHRPRRCLWATSLAPRPSSWACPPKRCSSWRGGMPQRPMGCSWKAAGAAARAAAAGWRSWWSR